MCAYRVYVTKLQIRWMKVHRIGGLTLWSLDTDDFYDSCLNGSYPLLRGMREEIEAPFIPPTTTTLIPFEYTTTKEKTTTEIISTTIASDTTTNSSTTIATTTAKRPTFKVGKKAVKPEIETRPQNVRSPLRTQQTTETGGSPGIQVDKNNNNTQSQVQTPKNNKQIEPGPKSKTEEKRKKHFKSRNENPNQNNKRTKPVRVGNRIVVRRRKVLRKNKNNKINEKNRPTVKSKNLDTIKRVQMQNKPNSQTVVKSNMDNGSETNELNVEGSKVSTNTHVNDTPFNLSSAVDPIKTKVNLVHEAKDHLPKAEPLNGNKEFKETYAGNEEVKTKTENANKPVVSSNANMDTKNGPLRNRKRPKGRKVMRKVARNLTKQQIENIRRRRRRMQQQRNKNNKTEQP